MKYIWVWFSLIAFSEAGVVRFPPVPKPLQVRTPLFEREREVRRRLLQAFQQYPPQLDRSRRRMQDVGLRLQGDTLFIRLLAIRVEFQEDTTPLTTGNGKFRLTPNEEDSILIDPETGCEYKNPFWDPPHDKKYFEHQLEALANYYSLATFGHVKIEYVVKPDGDSAAYTLPHPMTYYGDEENWFEGLLYLYRDALLAADQDTSVHFRDFNRVIIFHAGSAWQTDFLQDSPNDIAAVTVLGYPVPVDEGTDTIWDASILPETMSQDGAEIKLQGTLIHESAHNFFWIPDLYDTGNPPQGIGIGAWGIMCTGPYLGVPGQIPEGLVVPLPNAWERVWMDWAFQHLYAPPLPGFLRPPLFQTLSPTSEPESLIIYPNEILTDSMGEFLEDPYNRPRFYKIPINSHEYWLLEYKLDNLPENDSVVCGGDTAQVFGLDRDGVVVHFFGENDYLLPGKGLLIWHIDTLIIHNNWLWNTVEVPRPMGVDLEEAGRVQDLEYWTTLPYTLYGGPEDPYYQGNPNEFAPDSTPSSSDNQGGRTGTWIYGFSKPDTFMTFWIRRTLELSGFPRSVYSLPQNSYAQGVDLDQNDTLDLLITTTGSFDTLGHPLAPPQVFAFKNDLTPFGFRDSLKLTLPFGSEVTAEPAIVDLDGDGSSEILFPLSRGLAGDLMVYSAKDANQDGFFDPVWSLHFPDRVLASPSVGDIDQDGTPEILLGDAHARLFIIEADGTIRDTVHVGAPVQSPPALWDTLVIFQSADAHLWILNGRTGTPIQTLLEPFVVDTRNPPVLVDVDGDGTPEILTLTQDGTVHLLTLDGTLLWEKPTHTTPQSNLVVGDLDGDGRWDLGFIASGKLYAMNTSGALLSNFPLDLHLGDTLRTSSGITLDLNRDGRDEWVFWIEGHGLIAFTENAQKVQGFPYAVEGRVIQTPQALDLNSDDRLEILLIDSLGVLHAYATEALTASWAAFGNGPLHQSVVTRTLSPQPIPQVHDRVYLYPNPTYDGRTRLRFRANGSGTVTVQVFSYDGTLLKTIRGTYTGQGMVEMDPVLDLTDLAVGTYLVRVQIQGTDGEALKFLKLAILR